MTDQKKYVTISTAAKMLGVKKALVEEWIHEKRIECYNNYILNEDVEKVGQQIDKYVSLETFLNGIVSERFDSRYVKNRNKYIDFLEENDFLGISAVYPDELEFCTEPSASMFFYKTDVERLKKESEDFFRFFGLTEEKKVKILVGDCEYDSTKKQLSQYIKKIESFTPLVTHFVEETIKLDVANINNKTVIPIIDDLKYVGSKDLFIDYIDFAKKNLGLDIGSISRRQNHTSKDIGAYPYKKYVLIAKTIFNEEKLTQNEVIRKCFKKSIYFETWLFVCAHFVCGWRASDICGNWPYLGNREIAGLDIDIDSIPEAIVNGSIDEEKYYELGTYIEKSIELASIKAHKTGKASDLLAPIGKELKRFFGRMALISYYLQETSGGGKLESFRIAEYLNHVRLRELFGDDLYKELGRHNLSSRRLNKSYLQSMEDRARKDGAGTMAAYTIASLARNHSDADTTAIYIYDHGLSGETAEVVLSMMMDRGVFGAIRYMELIAAFPDAFKKLSAKEQTALLAECEASAYELETVSSDFISTDKLKRLFAEGNSKKALYILYEMFEISQGFGKSKDEGVHCKKRALREACENPVFEHCVLNACPYLIFTESGIKSLIDVIYTYSKLADETGHPKYKHVLSDVIIPSYKDILREFAEKMTPNESKALKLLIGKYNGEYVKGNRNRKHSCL